VQIGEEMTVKNAMLIMLIVLMATTAYAEESARLKALEERVKKLEERLAELEEAVAPVTAKAAIEVRVNGQRMKARERMLKDSTIYSREQLREIESLYQVANRKWQTNEGKDSLKQLIEKYDNANRTGCALLYLGQMSEGKEREGYLRKAIDDFSDCYYGDGVQVGAYARYYLAYHYKDNGQEEKAEQLFKEIASKYPDAIDHKGRLLSGPIRE
jgi:TolA-binding protein